MRYIALFFVLVGFAAGPVGADGVFTMGNSLTWDTVPSFLDGNVQWHVYCNRNLQYIFDNPEGHCVDTSTPWTTALVDNQYDWLVLQPFDGTTLDQDATLISHWMGMQPTARIVLHTGWAGHANFNSVYNSGNPDDTMRQSPEYFEDLIAELQLRNPGREITSDWTINYLHQIYLDIQNGVGPFTSLSQLYRDPIHMNTYGHYLTHNTVRKAIGQPFSSEGFAISGEIKTYLDGILVSVPEPALGLPAILALAWVSRSRCRQVPRGV